MTDDPRIYVAIVNELRERIASGDLKEGDPVPSITDLVRERGVSRRTCTRAMEVLETENLIRRWTGIGYRVGGKPAGSAGDASLTIEETMRHAIREARTQMSRRTAFAKLVRKMAGLTPEEYWSIFTEEWPAGG